MTPADRTPAEPTDDAAAAGVPPLRDAAATARTIEDRLRRALAPEQLVVHDDGHRHVGHAGAREGGHYTVELTSARFAGLPRIARHRLVYDALGPLAALGVHALAVVARSPGER